MRVLVDTNVILDIALAREPFAPHSAAVLNWCQENPGSAAVAWHSISNIAYLVKQDARAFLVDLLDFMEVSSGDTSSVREAFAMKMTDLEDALQVAAALSFESDYIITRNVRDYRKAKVKALLPAEFLKLVEL